jgi:hypothetical protein
LLKGFDQTINLILDESHERVFSSTSGVEQVVLGLYVIRGGGKTERRVCGVCVAMEERYTI